MPYCFNDDRSKFYLHDLKSSVYEVTTGVDDNSDSVYTLLKVPKNKVRFEYLYRSLYYNDISVYDFVKTRNELVAFNGGLKGVIVNNGQSVVENALDSSQYYYIIGFDANGGFMYLEDLDRELTATDLINRGFYCAFGVFSPLLIDSVEFDWEEELPLDDPNTNVVKLCSRKHTRTIFGFDNDFYYVIAVDGRLLNSIGATYAEMIALCEDLGITTAFNMDGGGSTQLWTCGKSAYNFVFPDNSNTNEVFSTRHVNGLIIMKEV